MTLLDNASNRVVITGLGVISPLGLDAATTWQGLIEGKSGVDYITQFDAESHETKFAGEVKNFDPSNHIGRKEARRMDRFTQMAVVAGKQAVEQSGLDITPDNQDDIGVLIGSGIGGLITLYEQVNILVEKGPDKISPFLIPMMITDMASAQLSIAIGVKGPNFCPTSACSSGSDAIGTAYEIIKRGDAVAMLAGGTDAIITPIGIAGFNACRALSTRNDSPQSASRPFDGERDGFVPAEGAAVLVLEDLSCARKRGANIIAEVIGYGASSDAYHITQPAEDGDGAIRAIKMALKKASVTPTDIDYINAHGTSTPLNDKIETMAIKTVFGDHAYEIPISSTKSMTGHLVGAAGAIEAAICAMTIWYGIIPPTINITNPDPECDLDYVPNEARRAKVRKVLSNSFGFGGHNSVLVFSEYSEA